MSSIKATVYTDVGVKAWINTGRDKATKKIDHELWANVQREVFQSSRVAVARLLTHSILSHETHHSPQQQLRLCNHDDSVSPAIHCAIHSYGMVGATHCPLVGGRPFCAGRCYHYLR